MVLQGLHNLFESFVISKKAIMIHLIFIPFLLGGLLLSQAAEAPKEDTSSVILDMPWEMGMNGEEYIDMRLLQHPATRIRRVLHMPALAGSNLDTGVDCEAFVQAANIFRYLHGQSDNPVMDQDFIDGKLVHNYFKFDSHKGVEATRQAIAIGALKGLEKLAQGNKKSVEASTYKSLVKIANKLPLTLYNMLRLGESSRIAVVKRVVNDGMIAAYWYSQSTMPTLPQTFRALRQQLGMPLQSKITSNDNIDPNVITQQLLTLSYYDGKLGLDSAVPTRRNLQVLFEALQKKTTITMPDLYSGKSTKAESFNAILSTLFNKQPQKVTQSELIDKLFELQRNLMRIEGNVKLVSKVQQVFKATTEGDIMTAWTSIEQPLE